MLDFSNRPPHWWLRVCMSLLFFVGGGVSVFWAQGFRVDFKNHNIVPTGVLSLETTPADIPMMVDGEYLGKTPGVFLGKHLGDHQVCFFPKTSFPLCFSIFVRGERVTNVFNILFPSQDPVAHRVGREKNILTDPKGRGYIALFSDFSEARVVEAGRDTFVAIPTVPHDTPALSAEGVVLFGDGSSQTVFFSHVPDLSILRFSPEKNTFLYAKENQLFLRDPLLQKSRLLTEFSEPVTAAWFFPHSESILVFLPSSIAFLPRQGEVPRVLFQKDVDKDALFFPEQKSILWFFDGEAYEYVFPQKENT